MSSLKNLENARNSAKKEYDLLSKASARAVNIYIKASRNAKTSNNHYKLKEMEEGSKDISKDTIVALRKYVSALNDYIDALKKTRPSGGSRKMKRRGRHTRLR